MNRYWRGEELREVNDHVYKTILKQTNNSVDFIINVKQPNEDNNFHCRYYYRCDNLYNEEQKQFL